MNLVSTEIEGMYYDGVAPIARPAILAITGNEAVLSGDDVNLSYDLNTIRVSPRAGHADRFISLSDGGQYQCADQPILDQLPQETRSEGFIAWLEDRIVIAVVSVAVIISTLLFGYFYGLPAIAEDIVQRIPVETEVSLGNHILTWFDENKWFKTSLIEQDQQINIKNRFRNLHEGLVISPHIELKFRNSEIIGPNAFAFPGGTIVITDQMIELAETDEEILAILAHEIGHAERRHSMRQLLQSSFIALAATTVTSDAASLSAAVAGLPVILAQTKYSRDFETEADEFALHLLKVHDISTEAFASIMESLDKGSDIEKKLSFISTHPITEKRIKRARESGEQ